MAVPALVAEIDFTGNPSAGYYDKVHSSDGLVSYWRLNSTSTFNDVLGVNNGVITNSPTLVSGPLPFDTDQGLSFNGTTQDAYVVDSSSLSQTGSMSLEAWVKVSSYPGATRLLVGKRGSYYLQLTSAGVLQWVVKNDTNIATLNSGAPLTTGVWYQVAGVHDTTAGVASLYTNGVLDSTMSYTAGLEKTAQPLRFAAVRGTTSPAWQSAQTATVTGTSLVITAPASIAAGDLLVAHITSTQEAATVTPPAGWVLQANVGQAGQYRTRVYYKIATGSEPGSYTFTNSSGNIWHGAISRFTGVDSLSPFANPAYTANVNSSSHPTGSHIPNVDNNMVVALFSGRTNNTWTEDSGTERYDYNGAAGNSSIAMSTQTQATAAAINITGTQTGGDWGSAILIVLSGTGLNYTTTSLDETTFWNYALTADDVLSHFTARLSGVGVWVNVTTDVKAASTNTGRQYELNRMEAGTSTVALNDLQRRYDPANSNSPFSPNIIPLRKMRLRATKGSTYPVFSGFVERWPERWVGPSYAETTLTLVDGFEPLALAGVSGTLPSALSGTQINTLLDKAGWPSADRAIDAGLFSMATTELSADAKALTEIQEIADSELGIFFIDAAGVATFHDRAHRWTQTRSLVSQATFVDAASGGGVLYTDLQPSFDKDKTINEWRVSTAQNESATDSDQVSAGAFFKRSQTRSTRLDNLPDAQTQATALVRDTAKPALRFDSLTVKPVTDNDWTTVLGLAISDRVTVLRNPVPAAGGSTISKFCFVEGINWQLVPGNTWQVAFQLSPIISATYYDTIIGDGPVSYWRMSTTT
jgi:hypothetical protein